MSSSSSSSVLQGLQSSVEPIVMEPRVLRLKLSPTAGSNPESDIKENPFTNTITKDEHSWSFIQPLSNICNKTEDLEGENVYVHPTVKFSSSMLSAKSLEMCTENLGCETGSNDSDSSDEMSLFSSEHSSCFIEDTHIQVVEVVNRNFNYMAKKLNRSNNFPPPLTSLTDFGGVHVRPHREDGRLILEAVTSSSPQPYFQAERSNGRLRLRLFDSVNDDEDDDNDDGEEEACDEEESVAEEELEEYIESGEDITKFGRPSRCKESGNRDIFGDGYFELPSLSLCL
ncbi:hypothetical protein Lal_00011863 [Lupinus albus]|uniref:Putative The fantastic four family protein n=1 Tax=Lupinus albus TaxID=3870 RepID=A0A6A4QD23_LUPAL|nr:putative The fantastic four family protein [Lupinus albus]KAF1880803.1 hypothetical protein Lal_00011863 [Lupinus albus]